MSNQLSQNKEDEICPSCGKFVASLLPSTGWCVPCSLPIILGDEGGGGINRNDRTRICTGCGEPVDGLYRRKCRECRDADWLLEHADEIDRCLANGLSVYKARQILRKHYRNDQRCLCCEGPMNKATKGTAYFCNKPQCRTAQNRLKKLIYSKGYDRTEA